MNTTSEGSSRHVGFEVVKQYFAEGLDGVIAVAGDPPARLVIAADKSQLGVRVPASESVPDVSGLANLTLAFIEDEDRSWHQMSIVVSDDSLVEVYPMLCSIIDRVQLSKVSFAVAVDDALDAIAGILTKRRGLSEDQQIGLVGELLTLIAVGRTQGFTIALRSWTGPLGEEHDFSLLDVNIEAKSTPGEKRQHWISGINQLVPTSARPLFLLSIQLTAPGAANGWSLPELAHTARAMAEGQEAVFDHVLAKTGFDWNREDLYRARWALRSVPQFFLVDGAFPVISPSLLATGVPSSSRIVDVRYRIDLTGLAASEPPLAILQGWEPLQ
jgi:hypothetical protein